jgi:lipoate-protein ligase A
MATDESIARAVAAGLVPATLRFYAWQPPALSLGRGQHHEDVDASAVAQAGYGLVRRPTGGRAILHIDELTYSIAAPADEPRVAGGIVESYRRLSEGITLGLTSLGIPNIVADQRAKNRRRRGAVCFEVPADYEITSDGKKLVGSAQMRIRDAVLQHGAIPLQGDIARICALLTARPQPDRVRARATTIADRLGRAALWDEVAAALQDGFSKALNLSLEPGELTAQERAWRQELVIEKYGTESWTLRI